MLKTQLVPSQVLAHYKKTLNPYLKYWLATQAIPPILLLTGQPQMGKKEVSLYLSQWILCSQKSLSQTLEPCSSCQECLNFLNQQSGSFFKLQEDLTESLKIDSFRQFYSLFWLSFPQDHYRILWIPNADRMTSQLSNAVLKIFEEPPAGWIFLMTAPSPDRLLPTVQSRCQTIRLRPLSQEELQVALQPLDLDPVQTFLIQRLQPASVIQALSLYEPEEKIKWELLLAFFKNPPQQLEALTEWSLKTPAHTASLMEGLEQFYAQFLTGLTLKDPQWNQANPMDLLLEASHSYLRLFQKPRFAWDHCLNQIESLFQARRALKLHGNRKLIIQTLLFNLIPHAWGEGKKL